MSARTKIIEFLQDGIQWAPPDSALNGAEVVDTPAKPYNKKKGVTVFYPTFSLAPNRDQILKEYDGRLELLCYSLVTGENLIERSAAFDTALELAKAVAKLFWDDPSVNGAVCDARITEGEGGEDAEDGLPYQLVALVLLYDEINQTGVG